MTHDLVKNIVDQLGASLDRVVINDLVDNTFYALLELNLNGNKVLIDSRPSDAIALALRTDCPIFVSEHVMQNSKNTISSLELDEMEQKPTSEEDDWLEDSDDEETGKYKM